MYGVNGKLIRANLSTGQITVENYAEELAKKYFGGSGLACYLFTSEFDNQVDALSPENPLFVINGLLTGTPVLTACKTSICAKSPLTGIWGEATVGGFWGAELKWAGYDGIIFTGKSKSPVYLWICGDDIELRAAGPIWGKNTFDAEEALRQATDPKARVMAIGTAGEKQSRLASIMTEGTSARAAGRTGLGAVMGSKNLKGIVVRSKEKKGVALARKKELLESLKEVIPSVVKFREGSKHYGTNGSIAGSNQMGDLPIKNWQLGDWSDKVNNISGQTAVEKYLASHYACYSCAIRCGKELKMNSGPYAGMVTKGPEYETAAGFGSNLLIDDFESVQLANTICNDYGIDTMSAAGVIAAVMDMFDKGVLSAGDLDGIEARWGDGNALIQLLTKMVKREGVGAILSDGIPAVRKWIGPTADEFTMAVKGMDIAYHDPRAFMSLGLNYATSNRGACHLEAMVHSVEWGAPLADFGYSDVDRFSFDGKGKLTALLQNYMANMNALGLCKFIFLGRVGPSIACQWTNWVMGWEMSLEDFMTVGDRIYNLKRLFNVRLGISRKDDTLPHRIATLDRKVGSAAGRLPYLHKLLPEYYEAREWDEFGIPTAQKIENLGIAHVKSYQQEGFSKTA